MKRQELDTNLPVREVKRVTGITNWQIADLLGVHVNTFQNKMHHEMPETEQRRIVALIEQWKSEQSN